jgi:hypothetical protein
MSEKKKQCSNCEHYDALKEEEGSPSCGWCEFLDNSRIPFWLDNNRCSVSSHNGADVLATDGECCDAFKDGGMQDD